MHAHTIALKFKLVMINLFEEHNACLEKNKNKNKKRRTH